MERKKSKLIFVHIPKTGGQTMMNTLYQIFGYENVLKIWGQQNNSKTMNFTVQNFMNLELRDIENYPCIGGHITLDDLISKLGMDSLKQQYHLYAIVRDPVDTVISLYNYYKTNTNHILHAKTSLLSFEEFILGKYHRNLQCHFLGASNAYDSIYNAKNLFSKIVTISNFNVLVEAILSVFLPVKKEEVKTHIKNVSKKVVIRESVPLEIIQKIKEDNYQDYLLFEAIKTQEKFVKQ